MPLYLKAEEDNRRLKISDDDTMAVFEPNNDQVSFLPDPGHYRQKLIMGLMWCFNGVESATIDVAKLKEALQEFPEEGTIELSIIFRKADINTRGPLFLIEGNEKRMLLAGHGKRDLDLGDENVV